MSSSLERDRPAQPRPRSWAKPASRRCCSTRAPSRATNPAAAESARGRWHDFRTSKPRSTNIPTSWVNKVHFESPSGFVVDYRSPDPLYLMIRRCEFDNLLFSLARPQRRNRNRACAQGDCSSRPRERRAPNAASTAPA